MSKNVNKLAILQTTQIQGQETVAVEIVVAELDENQQFQLLETFSGVSRCEPQDDFDPVFGNDLAFWRAVEKAAKRNIKRLGGQVKHADNKRRAQDRIKPDVDGRGVFWRGETWLGSNFDDVDPEGFTRGDLVAFVDPEIDGLYLPDAFEGKVGVIVGANYFNQPVVFHPDVHWMASSYVTNWSEASLEVIGTYGED